MSIWVRIGHLLRPGFGHIQAFPLFALLDVVGYATGYLRIFLAVSVRRYFRVPVTLPKFGQLVFTSSDEHSKQSTPCRRA